MEFSYIERDFLFNFYSDDMFISKKFLTEHHLKLTYQRRSISDLESKHKEWSKNIY